MSAVPLSGERLEIYVEEPSMDQFLRGLLPRILPLAWRLDSNVFIRPHEGKTDLQRSLRRKVGALHTYGQPVNLLVIHDQDQNDCVELKQRLNRVIADQQKEPFRTLVRIACRELENWYLGDLAHLFPSKAKLAGKAKYRHVDKLVGSAELASEVSKEGKIGLARRCGRSIAIASNTSASFRATVAAITRLTAG